MKTIYSQNREQRRKQKTKKTNKVVVVPKENIFSSLKVGINVVVVLFMFYILTMFITGNIKFGDNNSGNENADNTSVAIQYEEILAGEAFNMNYEEYYVIFYDYKEDAAINYKTIITNYRAAYPDVKIFTVDLSKGFNTFYVNENSNLNVDNIDDLRVNGPTVIKIKNGNNIYYEEGANAIEGMFE